MVYARCEDCYADGQAFGVWEFYDYNAEGKSFSSESVDNQLIEHTKGYWPSGKAITWKWLGEYGWSNFPQAIIEGDANMNPIDEGGYRDD